MRTLVNDHKDPQERRTPHTTYRRLEQHLSWVLNEPLPLEQHGGDKMQRAVDG